MGWKPLDVIVCVIAVTVCSILIAVLASSIYRAENLSDQGLRVVAGLIGSLVAIVGTYVGSKITDRDRD